MAILDLFRRFMGPAPAPDDRRHERRARGTVGTQVLVVDDSATIRAVLRKMLLQDGYAVLQAPDGEQGVALALAKQPGLIFLDVVLPGMSGFSALRALRRESATRTTPIVMMSGNQQATEQFYVRRIGADGFIKKPFGRADVFHAIRALVESGQMPARATAPPENPIPEGMSPEEWNAIPDVGLPDPAHIRPATMVAADQARGEPAGEAASAIPVAGTESPGDGQRA